MYQGSMLFRSLLRALLTTEGPDLRGFNHEVKVAAEKAGFNIWNHDSLYNLIWAVKRVALRASMKVNIDDRPPKDPVYPDRFRPSGFRDNTKRKRLGLPSLPATTTPLALNPTVQETQAERRKFRYKNKKVPATSKPTSKYVDFDKQGTQEHPIDLDYEDADDEYDPVAKRQRLDAKATSSTRRAANTSRPRAAQGLPRNIANKGAVSRPSDRVATMQLGGQTYVKTNARGEGEFAAGYGAGESQARQLINQLTRVENAMEGSANHMAWCNRSMSAAFIGHREILGGPNIHPLLERLSRSIEEAKSTLLHGAEILKDVAELVK